LGRGRVHGFLRECRKAAKREEKGIYDLFFHLES
jgi:hypothetical protein